MIAHIKDLMIFLRRSKTQLDFAEVKDHILTGVYSAELQLLQENSFRYQQTKNPWLRALLPMRRSFSLQTMTGLQLCKALFLRSLF